ncbi:MAG: response regulator, partial [Planctomycetes bacterium]|nr:response regulator [Planctomycetota bacterium]
VKRAGGLDPNIPRIRLLSTAEDLDSLKEEVEQRLKARWPVTKPLAWRRVEDLAYCDISVVEASFDATIQQGGGTRPVDGVTVLRAAFREEVHADLDWELRHVTLLKWVWSVSVALIALIASVVITRPLKRIAAAATSMTQSEFDSRLSSDDWADEVDKMTARLPLRRWDEIGDLARALNSMLAAVHGSYRELQEMNRDLDARVRLRTIELELAKTELEDTNAKLRESNNDLLRMNEIQRRFVHSITHELKTPLTSILGYCELLNRGDLSDDQKAKVGIVRTAGQRLLQLVNEILDSQKVVAGKLQVKIEEFDGNSLLKSLADSMIPVAQKADNSMRLACDRLPPISSDRGMVASVLENLLSNACKFTRNGTITIRASSEPRDGQDWILVEVADTGRGIPTEKQRLVFSSFPQILSKGENPSGTGLGLFNCKGYAEALGGTLHFESVEEQGTTFFLAFPAQLKEERRESIAPQPADAGAAGKRVESVESNVVLVIDDDPQICKLLADYLTNQGFDVRSASDGRSGVELARQLKPGFITLDAMMPGVDGWSVLKNLKSDPDIGHVPVIMISVLDDPNHKYKGMALGASDYITKPIDWNRLARTLRSYRYDKVDGTVLVVDDDPNVRDLAVENLSRRGWTVVTAENGRVALDRIAEHVPDLILLDLLMPEVDGFEFIQELRSTCKMDAVPVLVVTGKELSDEDRDKLNGRVEHVIRKGTVVWDQLQAEIDRLVRTHRSTPLRDAPAQSP